jgi:uncharacterized protein (TIGR02391 family)
MYFPFHRDISDNLWTAISHNYEVGNYTNAILDSIFLLTKVIRQKADIELDGTALIGKVFAGDNPILKINRLRTESERNEQKGLEFLLRGIYQGIRNPRSHEKIIDDKNTCDTIILLIDYLLAIIDNSKAVFDINDFCERVFDPNYVCSEEYTNLICIEVPINKIYDTLVELITRRSQANPSVYYLVFKILYSKLSASQRNDILSYVNNILRTTNDDQDFTVFVKVFQMDRWELLERSVRIRTENILIKSIETGLYNSEKAQCIAGALGTWLLNICRNLLLKKEFRDKLIMKLLSDNNNEIDYVFKYFSKEILKFDSQPEELLIIAINKGLKKGN